MRSSWVRVTLSKEIEDAGTTLLGVARKRRLLVGKDRPGDVEGLCPTGCDDGRRDKAAVKYHPEDGWHCHRCGARGGVAELLLILDKQRVPAQGDTTGWREARAAIERMDGVALKPRAPGARRRAPAPEPEPLMPTHEGQCEPWAAPLAEVLGLLPDRPPEAELAALRRACVPVTRDPEVAGWLRSRGLPPECVEEMRLAGALPLGAPELAWARYKGRPWAAAGYRLVVPAYDAHGALRSVRARLVTGEAEVPKELPPAGFKAAGLILCCPRARELLKSGAGAGEVWVVEGVPDWLSLALMLEARRRKGGAPAAVFGGWAGSWDALCRLPAGVRVMAATDGDPAGDRYAEAILKALPHGVTCSRRRRPAGDWNDLVREVRGG